MGLERISEVKIDHNVFSSFVLIGGIDNRHYIHGVYFLARHRGVFEDFLDKARSKGIDPSQFECSGGGFLDWPKGKLRAYGQSTDFGKFNVDVVGQLLSNYIGMTPELQGIFLEVE